MANPTTNFNWQMPTSSDLVTDLPVDFEVFGQAVDTALVDLKGGTTNQILAKNSNTDMDFKWVSDATGMTNPMTTTGDTIYSSSGSTPARLGIGTAGQYLKVNSGATAPEWATLAAGGMTAVASGTLSGSAVAITGIPSTYKHLQLVVTNYRPTTDNQSLRLRVNNDSSANSYMQDFAGGTSAFSSTLWNIASDVDNGASQGIIVLDIYSYNEATWKMGFNKFFNNNATTSTSGSYGASFLYYNNTTTISELNLFNSGGGNFTSGNYVVYGVN